MLVGGHGAYEERTRHLLISRCFDHSCFETTFNLLFARTNDVMGHQRKPYVLFVIYDTANRYEGISERTDEKSLRKGVISWPDESVRSLSVVFSWT